MLFRKLSFGFFLLGIFNTTAAYCQDTAAQQTPADISKDTMLISRPDNDLPPSYQPYDLNRVLFGFTAGAQLEHFKTVNNTNPVDSLNSLTSPASVGFNFGLDANIKITHWCYLAFTPNMAFVQRNLYYSFAGNATHVDTFKLQSTFYNFPLAIQIHSPRFHYTDIYVVGGGEWSFGTGGENVALPNPHFTPLGYSFVSMKNNLSYDIGGGISHAFYTFKLSLEVRYCMGITQLLIKDGTVYTSALDGLYNRTLSFYLRLESVRLGNSE